MYRPHLVVDGGEYLGVWILGPPDVDLPPDVPTECLLTLLFHGVDYSALTVGAEFEVKEGPTTVGHGVVLSEATG